jgi:microcystin-dependent protein
MPRDSLGTFSLPTGTLVSTGDTVLVSQHNPFAQDVAQALTNSIDRDGKGGMRSDLSLGSNKITSLADGVNPTDAATVGQLTTGGGVPLGAVIDYWGATPPENFMFAAGQEISRTTYADLFAVIGTFNLPDYRGRVGAGKDDMGGTSAARLAALSSTTLGAVGGAQTVALTTPQLASHTHSVTDPGHVHGAAVPSLGEAGGFSGAGATGGATSSATTGITIASAGSGEAHPNVQPTIIANKIMRVS